ncbi:hypothetical protein M3Y94_00204200 [Aphelenchoides besseyi]|nr:hypothetical protein M3Y94_00204200 [Aphelenchoides besseyi]
MLTTAMRKRQVDFWVVVIRTMKRSGSFFYRKLWNVVNELQLDIRTVTINFRNQKFTLPKFCLHCKIVKPKRTYHCSRCEKCVRRMCHHCLALGKCVHLANHKFFLLFLAYVVLMCWFSFTTTVNALYCTVVDYQQTPKPKSILFVGPLTFSLMGCAQSLIFPFVMIYFQWDFWDDLLKNQTKVEDLENELKESFDTGSRLENFETIFGKQRSLWFLPLQTTKLEMK